MEKENRLAVTFNVVMAAAVVICVIVIIAIPVFSAFRRFGPRQETCTGNLRQLGLALLQYEQDYDYTWPGGANHWAGQLYPYLKSPGVYHCPNDDRTATSGKSICSYAMNGNLPGGRITNFPFESVTVAITDFDGTPALVMIKGDERVSEYTTGAMPNAAWGGIRMGTSTPMVNRTRHDHGDNFLACDGHVVLISPHHVSSGLDNPSATGDQDAVHAAGTKELGSRFKLTFSER